VAGFRRINENSTKDEARQALSDVENTWANLQKSASTLEGVQIDSIEGAYNDLEKSVNDIPGDAALADAESMVKQSALSTLEEVLKISTTTCAYGQEE
jgi:hypothetical protein